MQEDFSLIHRVYYYETDKMGRVYHSNFLHWMEEARTEFLRSVGLNYSEMENEGVFLPVSEVEMKFYKPISYDDLIKIKLLVKKINKIKVEFEYHFYNEDEELTVTGRTVNVFTDNYGKLKRVDKNIINSIKE